MVCWWKDTLIFLGKQIKKELTFHFLCIMVVLTFPISNKSNHHDSLAGLPSFLAMKLPLEPFTLSTSALGLLLGEYFNLFGYLLNQL